jgi:hypothetical protein
MSTGVVWQTHFAALGGEGSSGGVDSGGAFGGGGDGSAGAL